MLHNRPYINLEKHIDLTGFDALHPEICRGIATAKKFLIDGNQTINPGSINPNGQGYKVNPLYDVHTFWKSLPETDPLKIGGQGLDYNQLTTYLKYALGAYDLYGHYRILENCYPDIVIGEIASHFPNLVNWILDFKTSGVVSYIHSASLLVLEAGGIPWEHFDPVVVDEEKGVIPEFIHIKTDLDRPFYMFDSETNTRTYINTRVAWWNERDWHGGEPILRPTYTLRINCMFSEDFKRKILEE